MAKDLEGKVFLVTGATEGIGKAAAMEFARRGATLVLVGRSKEKSERVVSELAAASGNDRIELLLGDLSSLADVRAVADAFRAKHDRLDALVNNAGAFFNECKLSADGIEMTFALNHVAYFLLTTRLLDLLQKTPGARVVSTSSAGHRMGKVDLATIAKRDGRAGMRAYSDSKLANVLFTRELARRLAGSGATANCYHPGFVHTGFARGFLGDRGPVTTWLVERAGRLLARSPEKGAETLVWLATSPESATFNGEYFYDLKVAPVSKVAQDDALARGLWKLSEQLVA
ncbi:SDR family oxidoreductase [Sorangium sp. So ce321]|uniref:SDR family oxidoreductase n=1 Tax=Sorangium sp. So ce321 TaxID=3133300 RepID=UPI003F6230EA